MFVFASILGSPRWRGTATALYLAAVLAFLLFQRLVRQQGSASWLAGDATKGTRAAARPGAGVAVVAVVAGLVLGPALPGAGDPAVVKFNGKGGGRSTRVT